MKNENFLAIDTSGNHLAVVACKAGECHTVFLPDCAMKHSVSVLPAVEEVLKKADLELSACDFFAAVVGAGSFTGIRIGISVVKGFCLAFGKPALPITSFDTLAYTGIDGKALCLVDALHDSYYVCGYEDGKVVYPPAYLAEEEVLALKGEGYRLRAASALPLAEKAEVELVDPALGLKNAACAFGAEEKFGELTALYVRKSSAELNLGK